MTLRTLISTTEWSSVYKYLYDRQFKNEDYGVKTHTEEQIYVAYYNVLCELKANAPQSPSENKLVVAEQVDWYYTHLLEHPEEVEILRTSLKFNDDGTLDKSVYLYLDTFTTQLNKSEHYGLSIGSWGDLMEMEIDNTSKNLPDEALLGEILWELTFFGFTEKKNKEFWSEIEESIDRELK